MKRSAYRYAVLMFFIMAAHSLLETARDVALLAKLGPDALALAYLAIAGVAVAAMAIARRIGFTRRPRTMLFVMLGIAGGGTLVLTPLLPTLPAAAFVLYGWSGVSATLIVPMFWAVVERHLSVAEAKRELGRVTVGGSLGALAGSGIAYQIAQELPPHHLAGAAGLAFGIAMMAVPLLASPDRPGHGSEHAAPPPSTARSESLTRYVRLLVMLGLVGTVAVTLGDLTFKRAIAERVDGPDLASWLAATYAGLNVVGLVVHLVVAQRLLRRGVGTALAVLPSLLLAGALGFVVTGALAAVIALKLADGGLRHNLHRVATEVLFLPVPGALRVEAKPLIEAITQRGGQAAAALIALSFVTDARGLGVAVVTAVILWGVVIAFTRAVYVEQFRGRLETHEVHRDVALPALDDAAVGILLGALASPDEAEASSALDLLAMRDHGIPALALYHPQPVVVRRALDMLSGDLRPDVARVLEHLVEHGDPQVRAAAIAASTRAGIPASAEGLTADQPEVRAAVAIALTGGQHDATARRVIAALFAGTAAEQLALARALRHQPAEAYRSTIAELAAGGGPDIQREVLHVWQHRPELADEEQLVGMLAHRSVRPAARRALLARGAFDRLALAMDDPRTPLEVRRHIPRTLSKFGGDAAVEVLAQRLLREPDGTTEFKIVRALGRLRADNPRLPLSTPALERYVVRSLEEAVRYRRLRDALVSSSMTPSLELLLELLREKREHAVERSFRALGVLYPRARMHGLYDAIVSGDKERGAAAREVLDETIPAPLGLALSRELDEVESRRPPPPYDVALASLLADRSDSLRSIAANHIAQSRLVSLREELVRLRPVTGSELVTLAFDQAIASFHA